jgi:chromosome segregation ATPase
VDDKCKDNLIDSLQKQLAHQTEMFDVKCKSSAKLANMLGDATAERDRLKAECDKLNAERSTKSMSSTDELNFLRQKTDDLVNRVCALEKERKTILEERDQLKAERDQLKAERDQLKAPSADEFKTAFDDANVTIGILHKRNIDLVEEVDKLAMTLFHATKAMDKVSAERDRLKVELDTNSAAANDAKITIDKANETIGFLRAAADKLSKELVQSNDKLQRLSEANQWKETRLIEAEKIIDELKQGANTIDELVSENTKLKQGLKQAAETIQGLVK